MKLSQLFGSEGGLSSQIDRPVVCYYSDCDLLNHVLPAGLEPATL